MSKRSYTRHKRGRPKCLSLRNSEHCYLYSNVRRRFSIFTTRKHVWTYNCKRLRSYGLHRLNLSHFYVFSDNRHFQAGQRHVHLEEASRPFRCAYMKWEDYQHFMLRYCRRYLQLASDVESAWSVRMFENI